MWHEAQLREISQELEPAKHSFTYTYPPPYRALRDGECGGVTGKSLQVWRDFSMYLHVPFCRMNCNFCSLHRQLSRDAEEVEVYLAALRHEVRILDEQIPNARLTSLYLGGGTPSMLELGQVSGLLDQIAASSAVEVTMECAPDGARDASQWRSYLRTLTSRVHLPVSRVSIGVQSWQNRTLRRMGRTGIHTTEDLLRAADTFVPSYNVDFVLGYPQAPTTMVEEAHGILRAVDVLRRRGLTLPSVSVYQLWDVDRIPATRRRADELPGRTLVAEALWHVQSGLYDRGYGSSAGTTFVRGPEHRHKWAAHRYRDFRHLGLGSGSYSFLPSGFAQRARNVAGYQRVLADDRISWMEVDHALNTVFHLTNDDVEIRRIIGGLRSGSPVALPDPIPSLSSRIDEILGKVRRLCEVEVLERQAGTVALAEAAFMLTNAVSAFLHPADCPRKPSRV
ncbi:radical SAM protein [Nonomuraea sp. NPDC059007]|uniref:radical SAM protein n=1 Tax=Nonomuraea sp. NPDC059007 TaxID=3346692 RepID=UPI003693FFCF